MVWPNTRDEIEQGFAADLERALQSVAAPSLEKLNETQVEQAVANAAEPWMDRTAQDAIAAILLLLDRRGGPGFLSGLRDSLQPGRLVSTRSAAQTLGQSVAANTRRMLKRMREGNFSRELSKGVPITDAESGLKPNQRDDVFGRTRAERIAVTETTRLAEIAERAAVQTLQNAGVAIRRKWQTAEDERVCPICRPLNDRPEHEWPSAYRNGPPAHVNCRCRAVIIGFDEIFPSAS
jgi:SPP1 gp7 family putative phage head morphogenesis protein